MRFSTGRQAFRWFFGTWHIPLTPEQRERGYQIRQRVLRQECEAAARARGWDDLAWHLGGPVTERWGVDRSGDHWFGAVQDLAGRDGKAYSRAEFAAWLAVDEDRFGHAR